MSLEFLAIDFRSKRELHRDPSWIDAQGAIDLLDGDTVSMVRLSTVAGTSLSIGGGEKGQYVVSGVRCSGSSALLLGPQSAGLSISVRNGRTITLVPSHMVVPKDLVIRVAELFWRKGNFDPGLTWQAA